MLPLLLLLAIIIVRFFWFNFFFFFSPQLEQAIEGVRLLESERRSNTEKVKDLLEDDEEETVIHMQVGMKKVAELLTWAKHVVRPKKMRM